MKKMLLLVVSLTIVLSFAACSTSDESSSTPISSEEPSSQSSTQLPNPIVNYDTLEEAETAVGFTVPLLNLPEGAQLDHVSVIAGNLVQLDYLNGENTFRYRVAKGEEDISGDYTAYEATGTHTIGDLEVTVKQQDGLTRLALWTSGEFTFSLSFPDGIDGETLEQLFASQQNPNLADDTIING